MCADNLGSVGENSKRREREWSVCDRRTCLIVIGDRTRLIERRLFSRVADWFSHNHSCLSTGEGYQSSVGGDAEVDACDFQGKRSCEERSAERRRGHPCLKQSFEGGFGKVSVQYAC